MLIKSTILTVQILVFFVVCAFAVPPEQKVEFGDVIFDGKVHSKGISCEDCHPKIFPMSRGAVKITMAEIIAGRLCGECHNGEKAFGAKKSKDCGRCHKGI